MEASGSVKIMWPKDIPGSDPQHLNLQEYSVLTIFTHQKSTIIKSIHLYSILFCLLSPFQGHHGDPVLFLLVFSILQKTYGTASKVAKTTAHQRLLFKVKKLVAALN
jgi:hypothetical protein